MVERISPEEVGVCPARLERIKPLMQSYIDQGRLAGIGTLLARRGKIFHCEQVGFADLAGGEPLGEDALFRIYSMTKPITCAALMMLYEEGRFQLFDPVSRYIPAFAGVKVLAEDACGRRKEVAAEPPPTLHHLLTHTAGLTYDFIEDSPVGELYRSAELVRNPARSLEAMVGELARLPLAYPPGSRWHYSLSFDVAAHLVEVLSGRPFEQFLRERLFSPLGMEDTFFCVPPPKRRRCATVYGPADLAEPDLLPSKLLELSQQQPPLAPLDVSRSSPVDLEGFARGGHGLFSTLRDYLRFAQMLLNGGHLDGVRLLGRKTIEFMHSNHLPARMLPYSLANLVFWPGYGFGLGSRVLLDPAQSQMPGSAGEFGWAGAAKTYYWIDPQEELIGLFMAQKMASFELPEKDFQVLAYQTLID